MGTDRPNQSSAGTPNPSASGLGTPVEGNVSLAAKADAAPQGALVRGATAIIPQKLVSDGEVVILAFKPSLWFILLVSGRWLIGCLLTIMAAELLAPWIPHRLAERAEQAAILVAAVRLLIGSLEWLGRVYVLTDRRVMRLKGVVRIDLFECPLSRIQQTELTLPLTERILFCGTLLFYTAGTDAADAAWQTVAHPTEVYRGVIEAMERYRGQSP